MQESLALLLTNCLRFIETEPILSHNPEAQLLLHRIDRDRCKAKWKQTDIISESKDGLSGLIASSISQMSEVMMVVIPIAGSRFIFYSIIFLQNTSVARLYSPDLASTLAGSIRLPGRKPYLTTNFSQRYLPVSAINIHREISQFPCPPITSFMKERNIALLQVAILAFALAFLFGIRTLDLYASAGKAYGGAESECGCFEEDMV